MNDVVTAVNTLSQSKDPQATTKLLKVLNDNAKSLRKAGSALDQVLNEVFRLPQHTLGYIHVLHAKIQNEVKNQIDLAEQCRRVLHEGELEQVALASRQFCDIARAYTDALILIERPIRGIPALFAACRKSQGANPNVLTSVHTNYVQICLKARCYSQALAVLDLPLLEIKPKENGLEPADYLAYFYYGGMVYCALKKWAKAIEFFQIVLTTPSRALSLIQVCAYKKYVLASLIESGEVAPLPSKLTSQVVLRLVERMAQPYVEFSRAYKRGTTEALAKVVSEASDVFRQDKNAGLVSQASEAMIRRNITRLTSTYMTRSLADIAFSAGLKGAKDAERYLVSMIEDGTLSAQINQKDGMVIFNDKPDENDTSTMIKQIDSKIQEVIMLSDKLKSKEKDLTLSPAYIVKTTPSIAEKLAGPAGMGMGAMGMHMGGMGMRGMGHMGMGMHMGGGGGGRFDNDDLATAMALSMSHQ